MELVTAHFSTSFDSTVPRNEFIHICVEDDLLLPR